MTSAAWCWSLLRLNNSCRGGTAEQDLLTAFAHPGAAAAGALLNNDRGSLNLLFLNERQPDLKASFHLAVVN